MTKELYIRGLNQSEGGTSGTTIRRGFRAETGSAAELTTALTGANNDLTFTAKTSGTAGNSIDITYTDPGGATATLDAVRDGDHIVVSLGRAASAINTTATALKAAVDADVLASAIAVLTSTNTEVTDGQVVVINDETYRFKDTMALANDVKIAGVVGVAASAVLTSDNTEVVDGDTVTVNDRTYRFKDTMAQAYDVKRDGTTADTTLANLRAAINGTGTAGVEWFAGTLGATGVTASAVVSHAITVTANAAGVAGNAFPKSESSIHLDWDGAGAFFTGGVDAVDPDVTLENLVAAVNGAAGSGTKYFAGTAQPTDVTASAVGVPAAHKVTFTATAGFAGNAFASTDTSGVLSFLGTTFTGGSDGASVLVRVANAQGSNGSGLVTALATTLLADGTAGGTEIVNNSASVTVDVDNPVIRRRLGRYVNEWAETLTNTNLVYIRSLGASPVANANSIVDRGFQIKNSAGNQAAVIPGGAAVRVDLNDPLVRKALKQHYSRWIVGNTSDALVTITGLTTSGAAGYTITRGFRIKEYTTGLPTAVTPGIDVQVNVNDAYVRRILRRNIGRYIVVSSP